MSYLLAVVDDLMFTSKIKNAATSVGVTVKFARSRAAALTEMRTAAPRLVLLDLNNPRTDPVGLVGEMKSDPVLAHIATIGFSQHTDTEAILAARKAGVETVLARGAFFEQLPALLAPSAPG